MQISTYGNLKDVGMIFIWDFQQDLVTDRISCEIATIVTWPSWWQIKTVPGNGLMLSGNKLLPEPMLTKFHDITLHHQGPISNLERNLSNINSSPLDKMAAILADNIFKCIFLNFE